MCKPLHIMFQENLWKTPKSMWPTSTSCERWIRLTWGSRLTNVCASRSLLCVTWPSAQTGSLSAFSTCKTLSSTTSHCSCLPVSLKCKWTMGIIETCINYDVITFLLKNWEQLGNSGFSVNRANLHDFWRRQLRDMTVKHKKLHRLCSYSYKSM
jgi:hypothetical protein